jgi:hypothetical protein
MLLSFSHYGNTKKLFGQNFVGVTDQPYKFARAFERLKSWWKTYARPCMYQCINLVYVTHWMKQVVVTATAHAPRVNM